jgi:hypothetical protein
LDSLRVISELTKEEHAAVCLSFQFGLDKILDEATSALKKAFEASDKRKQNDNDSKFNVVAVACGNISDFHAGIECRTGDWDCETRTLPKNLQTTTDILSAGTPNLKFLTSMEAEHCFRFHCEQPFTTTNYKVTTTPKKEWMIVLCCDEASADMRHCRRIPKLDLLTETDTARQAKLSKAEVVGVVLYTGPMVRHSLQFHQLSAVHPTFQPRELRA